jgi:hypothetical protein
VTQQVAGAGAAPHCSACVEQRFGNVHHSGSHVLPAALGLGARPGRGGHLQRVRRRTAFRTADRDAVLTLLSQPDGVEMGDASGPEVRRFSDLVEQLGGDRAD